MKLLLKILTPLWFFALLDNVAGFPADDGSLNCTVNGQAVNVYRDHSGSPKVYYYAPPGLRLTYTEVAGAKMPEARFYGSVSNNVYRGIIQLRVTAALDAEEMVALKKEVSEKTKQAVETFEVVPVGPINNCRVGIMFIGEEGGAPKVVDTVTAKPVDQGATDPKTPLNQPSSVGPTSLNQPFWVQFEAREMNAFIYEKLLRAETGGILAFLVGEYDAATPEYGVEATLNVKEATKFYRELQQKTSGWRVGPFGNRKKEVRETIRQSFKADSFLKVKFLQGADNPERWEAVEQALWSFILRECAQKKDASPGSDPKLDEPASMEMPSQKISYLGQSFTSPAIMLSFGRASAGSIFDFNVDLDVTRSFNYTGRFVRPLSLPLWGGLNVGKLPKAIQDSLFVTVSDTLPTIRVLPPTPSTAAESAAYLGSTLDISIPEGSDGAISTYGFFFDKAKDKFVPSKAATFEAVGPATKNGRRGVIWLRQSFKPNSNYHPSRISHGSVSRLRLAMR
jgi:hypothetical protein